MIGRTFCFFAGAAVGGYLVHKLNRTVRAWSPGGIADRVEGHVADYRAALREFNEDVQDAMERHEAELRRRYSPADASRALEPVEVRRGHPKQAHDMKDGH
ncbi:hypothetical protein ACQEU5_16740 [Marinactinospora thermotolerans]|uniref:Uncharacterized protein n=1 Tax=Marinactinospora thermotolerans DSM 45154 TaxID=1122192 RepID=A0A1T4SKA8_9ACTN|nr:hypothetical protein [Marinactinospora thermotolerans]SKA28632.1 hypothetical protein SAMN02745673_03596 [Marinactinospora thermotolerans DSM 45154]